MIRINKIYFYRNSMTNPSHSSFKTIYLVLYISIGVLFVWLFWFFSQETEIAPKPISQTVIKSTPVFEFGSWSPDEKIEILGTLESTGDIDIVAQTSGIVADVRKNIGDEVSAGEVVATIEQQENLQSLQYQNTQLTLQQVRSTTTQSILSAELALQSAQEEVAQLQTNETQNRSKNWETLYTTAVNSESTIIQVSNWADEILGSSDRYRYQQEATKRYIGNNDTIQRQKAKTQLSTLLQEINQWGEPPSQSNTQNVLFFAENRLQVLLELQDVVRILDILIRTTNNSSVFLESDRALLQTESNGMMGRIDGQITSLNNNIQAIKSDNNRVDLSLISAKNRVKNAKAQLEVVKSNAQSQIQNAENQVQTAYISKQKLTIKSPFSGVITDRHINAFSFINPGQKLYSVLSENKGWKVVGFVSDHELDQILKSETIFILYQGEKIENLPTSQLSYKTDAGSQKIKIEFPIPTSIKTMRVGSFASIIIPAQTSESDLIPISSVSFEPDGAEVLVLNQDNEAERRKVQYDRIIRNNIRITGGLNQNDRIIQFHKRVYAGDSINPLDAE